MRIALSAIVAAFLVVGSGTAAANPVPLPAGKQLLKCEAGQVKWYVVYQGKLPTGENYTGATTTCGTSDLGVTEAGLNSLQRTMKSLFPTQGEVIILNTWKLVG